MTLPVIALTPMQATAHVPQFNENANALGAAALYGIIVSRTRGLRITLYGGCYLAPSGIPYQVPEQYANLTPSTTNYLYADGTGVLVKTVTPTPSAGILLYTLVVGADAITNGTCHITGRKTQGGPGPQGPQGQQGDPLWIHRRRYMDSHFGSTTAQSGGGSGMAMGFGRSSGTQAEMSGFGIGSGGAMTTSAAAFYDSVCKVRWMGVSNHNPYTRNRDIEANFRIGLDLNVAFTPADFRFFVGLYKADGAIGGPTSTHPSIATIAGGGVEVSTFVDLIGIGCDTADANCQIIHNDSTGTATKVDLGSSFPAKTSGMSSRARIIDLTLVWAAGGTQVAYRVIDADPAFNTTAIGVLSTNLPAVGQGLGWLWFAGGNHTLVTPMYCQMAIDSRY